MYSAKSPNTTQGIGSPVTPQSYVVVNGQFDRPFFQKRCGQGSVSPWGSVSEENFAMMKHELAFSFNDPLLMPRGMSLGANDPELRFFTSANGIPINASGGAGTKAETDLLATPGGSEYLRRKIRSRLNFIGVNLTTMPSVKSGNTHASVAVAGAVTLINTGPQRIDIGQRVVWDLPHFDTDPAGGAVVSSYGTPSSKKLFQTVGWDEANANSTKKLLQYIAKADPSTDPDVEEMNELFGPFAAHCAKNPNLDIKECISSDSTCALENMLSGFAELQRELEFRVIGTALTIAEPGAPFDLLLRYNKMS